jgi:hypothetical protein
MAGCRQAVRRIAMCDLRERDGWNRLHARPVHEILIGARAAEQAVDSDAAGSNESNHADQQEPAELRRLNLLL